MSRIEVGGRFIRSGSWLQLFGFVMSVGMVLHYVVGAQYPTGHDFMGNITLCGRVRGRSAQPSSSVARSAWASLGRRVQRWGGILERRSLSRP